MPYHTQPIVAFPAASRLVADYFRSPGSTVRSTGAPESNSSIEIGEVFKPSLANPSVPSLSIHPAIAASPVTSPSWQEPLVPTPSMGPSVAAPLVENHVPFNSEQPPALVPAPRTVGSLPAQAPLSSPVPMDISPFALVPLGS